MVRLQQIVCYFIHVYCFCPFNFVVAPVLSMLLMMNDGDDDGVKKLCSKRAV